MAGNVQIRKKYTRLVGFLTAAVWILSGCGVKSALPDEYVLEERMAAFPSLELSGDEALFAEAFAAELCVADGGAQAGQEITGEAAAVFDLSGGTAVFEKNVFARMNPASTTKIMTAILTLKYGRLDDIVHVTDAVMIDEPGSSMAGIKPGDELTLEQLLYGLMLPSGNDAANAIAVHLAGSVENFTEWMNAEARRIGATGTHFANANGLTDPDHYTTAYDLYLMFHEALKYEKFREVIGAKGFTAAYIGADGEQASAVWTVGNYYMNGKRETPDGLTVFGGKSGTTQAAGYCLIMGSRTESGQEYASVVMKAASRDALYEDMTKIICKIVK
ncbi:MAG: D-alanyl-D-alanine carboxypeptidase [Lachnospiraceae bacterium]|nr:D-alanyl-D-alanine carboxypeptidase [Lachnospiraceae bacterium]